MIAVTVVALVCVAAGAGATYWTELDLRAEERIAYGAVLGLAGYVIAAVATGFVFGVTVSGAGAALVFISALAAPSWRRNGRRFATECGDLGRRLRSPWRSADNPWPLLAFLTLAWPFTVRALQLGYVRTPDGGLIAGNLSTWTDWQAHLAYAGSFAYGDNLPPELPTAAGYDLGYHFGIDFLAATFVPLGLSLPAALQVSSAILAMAFPAVLYLAVDRIFASRAVALVSVVLFTMFGGLGWTRLATPLREQGPGVLWDLPYEFTRDHQAGYWFENSVTGHLFPQRPTLFGFSLTLIVLALLWTARQEGRQRTFLFCGVVVGLMPIFHLFGFGTCLVLGVIWAAIERRREWLHYLVPALVLAVPVVLWLLPPSSNVQLWAPYVSGPDRGGNVAVFWLRNMGLFLPLVLLAQLHRDVVPRAVLVASVPVWLWFVGPNIVQPHPSDINASHYFIYFLLLMTPLVAAVLVDWGRRYGRAGLAVSAVALVSMTAAGALDLFKIADPTTSTIPLAGPAELTVAEWARDNTANDAVFAVGPSHLQPIPALGGRRVVTGYSGWVHDLGIPDWSERYDDAVAILQGRPGHEGLIDRYGVDYVVIGPLERSPDYEANQPFWNTAAPVVYDAAGYRIYEVNRS